jgi:hypothetical protein
MGRLWVTLGFEEGVPVAQAAARTVYPTALESSRFKLSVSQISGGAGYDPEYIITSGAEVHLAPGVYNLTVKAYKDAEAIAKDEAIAEGKTAATIRQGADTSVNITLDPTAGEDGTFEYYLTIPAGPDEQPILYIYPLAGGSVVSNGMIFLNAGATNHDTVDLAPGYYKAQLVINWGDKVAGFTNEFIHIYSGMTSLLKQEFTPLVAQRVYDFDLSGYFPVPVIGETPKDKFEADQYNGTITWTKYGSNTEHTDPFVGNTRYIAKIQLGAKSGYTFDGVQANQFIHDKIKGTDRVDGDDSKNTRIVTIVFPEPIATVTGSRVLNIVFHQGDIMVSGNDGKNAIYQGGDTAENSLTPSKLRLEVNGYADISWYVDGNTNALTANPLYLEAKDYIISTHYVIFNGSKGGKSFSQKIPFTVNGLITLANPDAGVGAMDSGEENFTLSKKQGNPITIGLSSSIKEGEYTALQWIVDGTLMGIGTSITIDAVDYSVGGHTLSLFIVKDGITWSQDITFTITE